MKISLQTQPPSRANQRGYHRMKKQKLQNRWLRDEIVVKSTSEFATQAVVLWKKDRQAWVCINCESLMPLVKDCIDDIAEEVLCANDLENGYFHVEVQPDICKITAFRMRNEFYDLLLLKILVLHQDYKVI